MIDTTEMYLRTVYELQEEGIVALRARIAERLGHSGPTVSQTVARMERDGLIRVDEDRHLVLTEEGARLATRVMRKHRLAERLLVDVLGLEWEYAHDEACRLEHVMSERVERRIVALIGEGRESPYGNPIPGLDELSRDEPAGGRVGPEGDGTTAPDEGFLAGVESLTELAASLQDGQSLIVAVRRIGEPAQVDHDALSLLTVAGLLPGGRSRIVKKGSGVTAIKEGRTGGEPVVVPPELASHVFAAGQTTRV
jgi:DtxR family Mn-dependent transcriptional regulator